MDYQTILTNIVTLSNIDIEHGKAIIFIWRNKEHLEEWIKVKVAASADLRIASLPLSQIRMFGVKEEEENQVCVLALAFGIEKNYSDTNCIFRMIVKRT